MVSFNQQKETIRVLELLEHVVDPEIPVLTLRDLGVLRAVNVTEDAVEVSITPTYAGCPAMQTMQTDIENALADAGYENVSVNQNLSPAWSTDWMSENGRRKLLAYGIAPPAKMSCGSHSRNIECPQCSSKNVTPISEFGSTACKALYRCQDCKEPFDYFKCI